MTKPYILALVTDVTRAACREQCKYATQMMLIVVQISLFEAGLLEPLQMEVSQNPYENLCDMQKAAQAVEAR